jgi:hypothetical protein
MFEKIKTLIEQGNLKKAVKALRSISKLIELKPKELLSYFQLIRRAGDFHHGALRLEKLGILFPELEVEMAFFLGELGAVNQAIRLLRRHPNTLATDTEIQRHLQLGNFNSLLHNYEQAISSYSQMQILAKNHNPVLECVAQLNIFGHRIYKGENLQENIRTLVEFKNERLGSYPLMKQGAHYFICLGFQKLNDEKKAQQFLQQAFSIGARHRMRESLLLELTFFQLNPTALSKSEISTLKKKILSQAHIIYMDQFYTILGQRAELECNSRLAKRYYQKVIYGNRPHGHFQKALTRWQSLNGQNETILGWQNERNLTVPISRHQIIYNQLEKKGWPLLTKSKNELALSDQSTLLAELTLSLSKNLGFPTRDAETWEQIWQIPFSFVTSPTVIRSLINRWRKSRLVEFAEIMQEDRKLSLSLRQGTKLFTRLELDL